MTLDYLDFDFSEEDDGNGSFDALASVGPAQLPALHAEITAVLAWAHDTFAGQRGPLDEGGIWDFDLQSAQECRLPEVLAYDQATRRLTLHLGDADVPRHTVSLSIVGSAQFCDALRAQFELS